MLIRPSHLSSDGPVIAAPGQGIPKCPACGSYDIARQTHITRVVFTCRRCGFIFT